MKKFDYYQPTTLKKAFSLMKKCKGRAQYIAGGTDVLVRIKQKAIQPDALISLSGIEALKNISHNGGLSLGSMLPFKDVEKDAVIARAYPALARAISVLANPQVRNVATMGGNLSNAAPSADCAPPLMVMEATLKLQGPGGEREVPIDEFFTGPGENCMEAEEILTQIRVPEMANSTGMAFLKVGRLAQDIAVVNAAALLVMDGKKCRECRLAVGAVAPVPLRLKNVEKLMEGEEIGAELLDRVSETVEQEVSPITDVRSTEEYRRIMSGVLIKRVILQALRNAEDARLPLRGLPAIASAQARRAGTSGQGMGNTGSRSAQQVPKIDVATTSRKSQVQMPKSEIRKVINFILNGYEVSAEVESHKMLLQVIRDEFQLTGTKEGCGEGECGSCTVLVNGVSVDSCLYPALEIEGKKVTTIEGMLGEGNALHPIQEAFVENGGVQCGFCTPGMIMSAKALLDEIPDPNDEQIRRGISGNLCRCTGYVQIIDSIRKAVENL
jgi:xanthine dehydrogenase iron-sulfur cluster and FAD-binding subunit A